MGRYQIAFVNCEGVFPQQHEVYNTKEEAERVVEIYNSQKDNPWCYYKVITTQSNGE